MDKNKEAAIKAERMINGLGQDGRAFINKWIGFAAFYEGFDGRDERLTLINAVAGAFTNDEANALLKVHQAEIEYLFDLPPGDLRYEGDESKFRHQTQQDIYRACNQKEDACMRIGHLVAVIYQVRNNLVHGAKDPTTLRSQDLFLASDKIMSSVLGVLLEHANPA